ncbi:MAG: PEP-CTERM sorting domain-containing protein [Alphaproteobacteria bacterium]
MADLFSDPTILASNLTEADFSWSFLSFTFGHPKLANALKVERGLDTVSFTSDSVPEPGTVLVFGVGVLAIALNRRHRRRHNIS